MNSRAFFNLIHKLVLIVYITLLFLCTFNSRKEYLGVVNNKGYQWCTGSSTVFSRNWYREGGFRSLFTFMELPKSIEASSPQKRRLYISYPPGTIIPLYFISKLITREPSVRMVIVYNMAHQFLIAFFLALTVYYLCLQLGLTILYSYLFSFIPPLFLFFLRGPHYFFMMVFFSDAAVLLPYAAYLFFEVYKWGLEEKSKNKALLMVQAIQGILIFYGTLTDWLFIFFVIVLYFLKIVNSSIRTCTLKQFIKTSFVFVLPVLLAILLFVVQLTKYNLWQLLYGRFKERAAIGGASCEINVNLFKGLLLGRFFEQYGYLAIVVIAFSAILMGAIILYTIFKKHIHKAIDKNLAKMGFIGALSLFPCFMQIWFLKCHTVCHTFSMLKFVIPLAICPFVLIPLVIIVTAQHFAFFSRIRKTLINSILIVNFFLLYFFIRAGHDYSFPFNYLFPKNDTFFKRIGEFVETKTNYNDVVFSPNYEIAALPPVPICYSMKRVYKFNSVAEIENKLDSLAIDNPYTFNILVNKNMDLEQMKNLNNLISIAQQKYQNEDFILYKIDHREVALFLRNRFPLSAKPNFKF